MRERERESERVNELVKVCGGRRKREMKYTQNILEEQLPMPQTTLESEGVDSVIYCGHAHTYSHAHAHAHTHTCTHTHTCMRAHTHMHAHAHTHTHTHTHARTHTHTHTHTCTHTHTLCKVLFFFYLISLTS